MSSQLDFITDDLRLRQSELYRDSYVEIENKSSIPTYNDLSIHTLNDWANSLINSYELNPNQVLVLSKFLDTLNTILSIIDPLKIKAIQTSTIDDTDLLVWRETPNFIVELTFDDEGFVIYRKTYKNNQSMQKGLFNLDSDFQRLLFKFLA